MKREQQKKLYRKKDIFSMNDFSHRHFANIRITLQRHKMIKKRMKTEHCLRNKQKKKENGERWLYSHSVNIVLLQIYTGNLINHQQRTPSTTCIFFFMFKSVVISLSLLECATFSISMYFYGLFFSAHNSIRAET